MKTTWHNFEIESELVGKKVAVWSKADNSRNHHVITITNTDEKVSTQFDYWCPESDMNEEELLDAMDCFFSDAEFGESDDFYDFCCDMGYEIPRGTYESWKVCRKANSDVVKVFGTHWNAVANELRELRDERY